MPKRIYIPSQSFEDWKRLLAQPDLHWKAGYSAMTLAWSWEAAQGFPPEVVVALATANDPPLQDLSMLIAIPELQVALPGGERPRRPTCWSWRGAVRGLWQSPWRAR